MNATRECLAHVSLSFYRAAATSFPTQQGLGEPHRQASDGGTVTTVSLGTSRASRWQCGVPLQGTPITTPVWAAADSENGSPPKTPCARSPDC